MAYKRWAKQCVYRFFFSRASSALLPHSRFLFVYGNGLKESDLPTRLSWLQSQAIFWFFRSNTRQLFTPWNTADRENLLTKSCRVLTGELTTQKGTGTFCIPTAMQSAIVPNSPSGSTTVCGAPARLPAKFWLCILPLCAGDKELGSAQRIFVGNGPDGVGSHWIAQNEQLTGHGCSGLCITGTQWNWRVPKCRGCSAFKCWATTDKSWHAGLSCFFLLLK